MSRLIVDRHRLQVLAVVTPGADVPVDVKFQLVPRLAVHESERHSFAGFLAYYWSPLTHNLEYLRYKSIGTSSADDKAFNVSHLFNYVCPGVNLVDTFKDQSNSWVTWLFASETQRSPLLSNDLFPFARLTKYITQPRVDPEMPIMFVSHLMQAHVPLVLIWATLYGLRLDNTPRDALRPMASLQRSHILAQLSTQHPWLYVMLREKCVALTSAVFNALNSPSYPVRPRLADAEPYFLHNELNPLMLYYCDTENDEEDFETRCASLLYAQEAVVRSSYPFSSTLKVYRQNTPHYTPIQCVYCPSTDTSFEAFATYLGVYIDAAVDVTSARGNIWTKDLQSGDEYIQLPFHPDNRFYDYNHTTTNPWIERTIASTIDSEVVTAWHLCVRLLAALPYFDEVATTRAFEYEAFTPPPFVEIRKLAAKDTDNDKPTRFTLSHASLDEFPLFVVPLTGSVCVELEDDSTHMKYVQVVTPGALLELPSICTQKQETCRTYITRANDEEEEDDKDTFETWVLLFRKNSTNELPLLTCNRLDKDNLDVTEYH